MGGRQELSPEMRFVVDRLVAKVFQGDEGKRGLATNCASVAIAALQDHTSWVAGDDPDEVAPALEKVDLATIAAVHAVLVGRWPVRDASTPLPSD